MSEDTKEIRHRDIIPRGNDDEDDDPDRKTLYDQIQEAKELKSLEIRQQLEQNNASYKLDDKSREFYSQIEEQERDELKARKAKEAAELNKFKLKKQLLQNSDKKVNKPPVVSAKPKIVLKKKLESSPGPINLNSKEPTNKTTKKRPTEAKESLSSPQSRPFQPTTSLLQGYSDDSDSDS